MENEDETVDMVEGEMDFGLFIYPAAGKPFWGYYRHKTLGGARNYALDLLSPDGDKDKVEIYGVPRGFHIDTTATLVETHLRRVHKVSDDEIFRNLEKSMAAEYAQKVTDFIVDEVRRDIDETAGEEPNVSDLRLAIGRVICSRLGIED